MATEEADGFDDHFRSVTVTAMAALAGVVAALVSMFITAGVPAAEAAGNSRAQLVVLAAIFLQPPLLRVTGLKTDIGTKDVFFLAFMTFSMWFVSWTILLTTGA